MKGKLTVDSGPSVLAAVVITSLRVLPNPSVGRFLLSNRRGLCLQPTLCQVTVYLLASEWDTTFYGIRLQFELVYPAWLLLLACFL